MGSVKVKSVMFMTGWFPFKYGQLVYTACQEVESWDLMMTGQ